MICPISDMSNVDKPIAIGSLWVEFCCDLNSSFLLTNELAGELQQKLLQSEQNYN